MNEAPFFLEVDKIVDREALRNSFLSMATVLNPEVDVDEARAVSDGFISAYSESHGRYHNLTHLQHLLRLSGYFKHELKDPTIVQAAIWGHDVIRDPRHDDNEERSAELATDIFIKLGIPTKKVAKIGAYIMATKFHSNHSGDPDLDYFLDMDMSILGSPWDKYFEYAKDIQREYDVADPKTYIDKRIEFLEKTMKSPIFKTRPFAALEIKARTNIDHEIAWLKVNPRAPNNVLRVKLK